LITTTAEMEEITNRFDAAYEDLLADAYRVTLEGSTAAESRDIEGECLC
jgi:hypothetical protein